MSIYNPIKNIVFLTQEEAVAAAHSLNFGDLKNDMIGVSSVEISDTLEASRDTEEDIYFSSETDDAFYSYTIEKHEISFILKVYRTIKHGMISAAKRVALDAWHNAEKNQPNFYPKNSDWQQSYDDETNQWDRETGGSWRSGSDFG